MSIWQEIHARICKIQQKQALREIKYSIGFSYCKIVMKR